MDVHDGGGAQALDRPRASSAHQPGGRPPAGSATMTASASKRLVGRAASRPARRRPAADAAHPASRGGPSTPAAGEGRGPRWSPCSWPRGTVDQPMSPPSVVSSSPVRKTMAARASEASSARTLSVGSAIRFHRLLDGARSSGRGRRSHAPNGLARRGQGRPGPAGAGPARARPSRRRSATERCRYARRERRQVQRGRQPPYGRSWTGGRPGRAPARRAGPGGWTWSAPPIRSRKAR